MGKNVLIVAAHPDDEILGMGGTIARHVSAGDQVFIVFLGTGVGARDGRDDEAVARRAAAAQKAADVVGAQIVTIHEFPDNAFDSVPLLLLVQAIEAAKQVVNPDLVYTHHGGDLNVDHQLCCKATLTAFRPQPGENCREIRTFEVNSSTEWSAPSVSRPFQPDTYVDISATLDHLEAALSCYGEEMRASPHARSIEAVINAARRRGAEVGLIAAESFMVLRRVLSEPAGDAL